MKGTLTNKIKIPSVGKNGKICPIHTEYRSMNAMVPLVHEGSTNLVPDLNENLLHFGPLSILSDDFV